MIGSAEVKEDVGKIRRNLLGSGSMGDGAVVY
jgi:hypothetical protein